MGVLTFFSIHIEKKKKDKNKKKTWVDRENPSLTKPKTNKKKSTQEQIEISKLYETSSSLVFSFDFTFNGCLICSGNCVWWVKMCVFVFFFCLFVSFGLVFLFLLCLVAVKKMAELLRKVIYFVRFSLLGLECR